MTTASSTATFTQLNQQLQLLCSFNIQVPCNPQGDFAASGYKKLLQSLKTTQISDSLRSSYKDEQLIKWQKENLNEIDKHFNWKRFCDQVLSEIENEGSPNLDKTNLKQRLYLFFAELRSPMFWGRPDNFYKFLKANLKYIFQNKL